MRGVIINKGTVGASTENLDGCSGLLLNGVAIAATESVAGVVIGTTYKLTKLQDALDMGIDAAYDTANNVRVYRHISEFYRMAGDGTVLYLMVCAQTKTPAQMIADHGHALVAFADGDIRFLAVGYNPASGYSALPIDGMETVVREAIAPAQALHDWTWDTDRPLNVILEGRGMNGLAASMLNLRGIEVSGNVVDYGNVSVCIGQDWTYADGLTGFAQNFADIGTLLGSRAYLPCNRNIGEVGTMNITNTKKSIWLVAGLSNHSKIADMESSLETLDEKGYVFGISYTGITGYRWNNDHVCAPEVVDADGFMNESTMAYGATLGKAARKLRVKLLPKVKTTVPVDTSTGLLPTGMVKYFEGLGDAALAEMIAAGEISGGKTTVDATSNLLSGTKELKMGFVIVPTGTINEITGSINLKTTLS